MRTLRFLVSSWRDLLVGTAIGVLTVVVASLSLGCPNRIVATGAAQVDSLREYVHRVAGQ